LMGGLFKVMPVTAVGFLLCIFSIIGIPPLGGFFSKLFVIQGIVQSGNVAIASLAIFTAVLTALYLLRLFTLVFLGEPRDSGIHAHAEGTPIMVYVVATLAVLSIVAGIFVSYPMDLVNVATGNIATNPGLTSLLK
jgi:formate hydrogenlyase subunit 3/multisubunit Na+/H+ antiporter MnhD subunit